MNTESHYICEEPTEARGLGRMPTRPAMLRPVLDEPAPRNRTQQIRPRVRPRPIPKPKPVLIPRPVIDKNPVPAPPKLNINTVKKPTTKQSKPTSKPKTTNKSASKQQPDSHKDILAGTFSIGGMQVKKTHAAMAGGGIAGGLLLWKILF
ncbi:hypothetical protein SAMN06265218_1275 [Fodinibius sediminis]|uniref:Uncharacterized protein n=1 Tax=Fodinibius sediminis TaxID=1214077 RepID=A0A521F9J6_9BACT|nr:hypothetical protein SAMN06265218_1275 [Fodinibius sediminis]